MDEDVLEIKAKNGSSPAVTAIRFAPETFVIDNNENVISPLDKYDTCNIQID